MSTKITYSEAMGREITATRQILSGEIIETCELLILNPVDTTNVNNTDLQFYTFVYNEQQDCLVLGNGELYNHSDNANVKYFVAIDKDGRPKMFFQANQDISENEQLFIDYTADYKVDVNNYTVNLTK